MKTCHQHPLVDAFQRKVNYLRISVTDRCNLRCRYCAPSLTEHLPKERLLSLEEIQRLARIGIGLGINKIRLTGGEPLFRRGITNLVERLCELDGLEDIALTTNGTLIPDQGRQLKQAGLNRINISLDTLNKEKFRELTGADLFHKAWDGIMTAAELGFDPVKVNTVVMKGYNDDEIEQLADLARHYPFHVRFIEYMPIGTDPNGARKHFFSIAEIEKRLNRMGKLIPIGSKSHDGPALRYRFEGAPGEIGLIGSMSAHFCSSCNRIRLTAAGHLRPCLLADDHVDVITPMRQGATDEELEALFAMALSRKSAEHRLNFSDSQTLQTKMVSIGG